MDNNYSIFKFVIFATKKVFMFIGLLYFFIVNCLFMSITYASIEWVHPVLIELLEYLGISIANIFLSLSFAF